MSDLGTVIRLIDAPAPEAGAEREGELLRWRDETWERVLLGLPTEANVFRNETERSWEAVIDGLNRWCRAFPSRPEEQRRRYRTVFGHLGLLLVTLVSLRHSSVLRYTRDPGLDPRTTHDCDALCVPIFRQPAVREAFHRRYAPRAATDSAAAGAEWQRIDVDSLTFHRHGTTSFLLAGRSATAVQGHRRPLALKSILFPYLRLPAVVEATSRYMDRYGLPGTALPGVAHVWASSGRWILMDLVPGETLAEYLWRQSPRDGLRVDLLSELGPLLFDALSALERVGLVHGDLSPSNVIVRAPADGPRSLVLVDLGVNHLYSHAVSGSDGPDARYVAPEVRDTGRADARTDVFALGHLLITIAGAPGGWPERTALVPDGFYAESPVLARFVEDLTDRAPENRLLIFRPDPAEPLYRQLAAHFADEIQAVRAAREERREGPLGLLAPLSGAPGRARRMWRVRRAQALYRDPRRGMFVRWLMFWSWLSAAVWGVVGTLVLFWWQRDLGWDWGNRPVAFLQRGTGASDGEFPGLDALREYPVDDAWGNLPVRLVAASSLLVGIRHYQNVFAAVTPLIAGRGRRGQRGLAVRAWCAEATIRLWAVAAAFAALPPTLVQRDWWPISLAIGVTSGFLCAACTVWFAHAAHRQARAEGLSTVPSTPFQGVGHLVGWAQSTGVYALLVWGIGTLLVLDLADDEHVYASMVTVINIGIIYLREGSGSSAASVRTGLTRACLAAERLRYRRAAG